MSFLIWEYIKIYLHLTSFFDPGKLQIVKTKYQGRRWYTHCHQSILSLLWLLMNWHRKHPRYQYPWHYSGWGSQWLIHDIMCPRTHLPMGDAAAVLNQSFFKIISVIGILSLYGDIFKLFGTKFFNNSLPEIVLINSSSLHYYGVTIPQWINSEQQFLFQIRRENVSQFYCDWSKWYLHLLDFHFPYGPIAKPNMYN